MYIVNMKNMVNTVCKYSTGDRSIAHNCILTNFQTIHVTTVVARHTEHLHDNVLMCPAPNQEKTSNQYLNKTSTFHKRFETTEKTQEILS